MLGYLLSGICWNPQILLARPLKAWLTWWGTCGRNSSGSSRCASCAIVAVPWPWGGMWLHTSASITRGSWAAGEHGHGAEEGEGFKMQHMWVPRESIPPRLPISSWANQCVSKNPTRLGANHRLLLLPASLLRHSYTGELRAGVVEPCRPGCRLKEQLDSAGCLAVCSSHAGKAMCWFANASSRSQPTPLIGVGSSLSPFPTPGSCKWVVCALWVHLR